MGEWRSLDNSSENLYSAGRGWRDPRGDDERRSAGSPWPPARRKELRAQHSRPLLDAFFAWAEIEYDPEAYLRDLLRLVHWSRDRYLALTPLFWTHTRARLDPRELELPFGPPDGAGAPVKQAATS